MSEATHVFSELSDPFPRLSEADIALLQSYGNRRVRECVACLQFLSHGRQSECLPALAQTEHGSNRVGQQPRYRPPS